MNSQFIKQEAHRLGFSHCGMAPAEAVLPQYAEGYRRWLDAGCQADMHYLENYFEKRMDPRLLVEGAQTVISVAMNYRPATSAEGISWYAQGLDYHDVVKERLQQLMQAIGAEGRCFVDTAPVPERYWAWRCGLGWIGKHSQLVIPGQGSTFFLGELIITQPVDTYDNPMPNRCGQCRRCLDACPTGAITAVSEPVTDSVQTTTTPTRTSFDSNLCLSYLTIENRGDIPQFAAQKMGGTFYGCDRCLRACPHLKALPTTEAAFQPRPDLLSMTSADWQHLTRQQYQTLFKGSAVKRAKYEGLLRNLFAMQNS